MQFMTSLLGESTGTIVTSVLALGVVLVLIVLGLWVLKLSMRSTTLIGRGRNRRLSVIDHMQVDPKRQLLIVRRDNVEHLILTGGPQDLVIESGIPVERPPVATQRTVAQAEAPATPTLGAGEIDRLRSFIRPAARKPTSLRHTGLLRPVSTMEPAPAVIPMPPMAGDNPTRGKPDSATNPEGIDTNGRAALGAQRNFGDGN